MPAQPHSAQTLPAPDSVVVDSAATLVAAPRFIDGFATDTMPGTRPDTAARESPGLDVLPVLEMPAGNRPVPLRHNPLHDSAAMSLMLAAAALVAMSYRTGYKYFDSFLHNMFSTRRRENLFDDRTMSETWTLTALMVCSCVAQALLAFVALDRWALALSPALNAHVGIAVASLAALAAGFYLAQLGIFSLIGNVFADAVNARLWTAGFNATQALLGLALMPVAGAALLLPQCSKQLLIFAIILYFCARIVFICKGFRIFYSNLPSLFYFILYLCAAEVVPVVLICTIVPRLCILLLQTF